MTPGSISRRYARALYDLAMAESNVAEVGSALGEVATAVTAAAAEVGPGVLGTEERRRLGASIARPFGESSTFGKFVQLVALRDRLGEMPGIAHWFEKFQDDAAGRVRLKVRSPEQLSGEAADSIVRTFSKIAGKEILTEQSVDPSLLGGAVVELEGRVFDGSIKTKLARMAARMAGDA
jgi:F-type H+-transporting ATPase subunit delta